MRPLKVERVNIQILKDIEFNWMSFWASQPIGKRLDRDHPRTAGHNSEDSRERHYCSSMLCLLSFGSHIEQSICVIAFWRGQEQECLVICL